MADQMDQGTPELDSRRCQIAHRRLIEETGGITVNGMAIATDRESQGLLTGAALNARVAQDAGQAFSIRFKCDDGAYVTLDETQIISAAEAVSAHVKACFVREEELMQSLEAGTYQDTDLGTGWPS